MKTLAWLYLGISSFACCIGIIIGLSSSPVVGVFVTAIFGVVGGIIALQSKPGNQKIIIILPNKEQVDNYFNQPRYKGLGVSLLVFSVSMIVGISIGIWIRNRPLTQEFVWNKINQPKSLEEALDWILLSNQLSNKGFTREQIQQLYSLKDKGISPLYVSPENKNDIADTNFPVKKSHTKELKNKILKLSLGDTFHIAPQGEDINFKFNSRSGKPLSQYLEDFEKYIHQPASWNLVRSEPFDSATKNKLSLLKKQAEIDSLKILYLFEKRKNDSLQRIRQQ